MEYTWKDWELFDHVVVLFELDMNILESLCSFCAVWSIYKHIRVSLISLFMQFEVYINILESLWSHCLYSLKYTLNDWSLFLGQFEVYINRLESLLCSLKYTLNDWNVFDLIVWAVLKYTLRYWSLFNLIV